MLRRFIEFELNTPEKYWLVVFGYHIHKSFWGVLLILAGIASLIFYSLTLGLITLVIGIIVMVFSIVGHIQTNHRPLFQLWEKYERKPLEERKE